MATSLHKEKYEIAAKYHHHQSQDYVYYDIQINITDAKKMPVIAKLKMIDNQASFVEPPPNNHIIKAPNIIELQLKLNRWFSKYGFILKHVCKED
ncbi:hypothetical protein P4C99_10745 [Pontiellaceae bacterium B1224]|nr:hypothetical protein [Pontiellaceae bacterium B1224]